MLQAAWCTRCHVAPLLTCKHSLCHAHCHVSCLIQETLCKQQATCKAKANSQKLKPKFTQTHGQGNNLLTLQSHDHNVTVATHSNSIEGVANGTAKNVVAKNFVDAMATVIHRHKSLSAPMHETLLLLRAPVATAARRC